MTDREWLIRAADDSIREALMNLEVLTATEPGTVTDCRILLALCSDMLKRECQ